MLIAVCSDKGSPGVTTSALVLASAWSTPAMVVEMDQSGGDLALRLRHGGSALPETPTVLTVATAARSNQAPDLVSRYAHQLSQRVSVVPGAIVREQMAGIGDWEPLGDALAISDLPVLVDLGAPHTGSKVLGVAARADLVIVVGRPDPTSVIRMRERLSRLAPDLGAIRGIPPRFLPLLVTTSRHGDEDVADLLSVLDGTPAKPFIVGSGFIAIDPAAVRRLETGEEPTGRLARTVLMRTARVVVERVRESIGARAPVGVRARVRGAPS